uniref:Serine aminopeptidase S33 domain-containing protein n=1 Tax=Tetradesmus obliquus TaxID=3088 RepID=A0A383WFB9_TETOB|eukprot:jgi/Sobl393_1/1111/SZX72065.1
MRQTEFTFVNGREQSLVGTEFLPDSAPWATLIWHHGVCEHSGRYTPVFKHLADAGVAVYTYDVYGHGRSEPKEDNGRCLITDYNYLADDLYTFVGVVEQRVGGRLPAASTFLGGQSMGGLVVALACLRCQERWAGLVVFSGAMGVVWTYVLRAQAAVGNLLSSLIPRQKMVPAVKPENLHPDPAVVAAFKEDPLIFHGDLRVATGNELLRAMKHLAKHRSKISLPLYAVHGTKDAVTSLDAIEEFTGGVSSKELQLVKVEGGYHEMLMGEERIGSADGIMAWMKQRLERPWQQQQEEQQEDGQQPQDGAGVAAAEHACGGVEGAAAE